MENQKQKIDIPILEIKYQQNMKKRRNYSLFKKKNERFSAGFSMIIPLIEKVGYYLYLIVFYFKNLIKFFQK